MLFSNPGITLGNEEESLSSSMLVDDGNRDNEGHCLDKTYIFSGRAGSCHPRGTTTAYKDCCADKGVIYTDSKGSLSDLALYGRAVKDIYKIGKAAYAAYKTQLAAGATKEVAKAAAQVAAKQQLILIFDPLSLAVTVGLYFAMDYLENACNQEDMETAMLNGSGYCVEVGTYCKDKMIGIGCVQELKTFCCFNSKMARIIQEQGRKQLITLNDWGDIKNPDCRGFTPEEFQSLDFSKIDLSEYFNEITYSMDEININNINEKVSAFAKRSN